MPKNKRKEENDSTTPAVRGMWTGTISFGLVSVPVSLFPALRRRPVHLRWLSPEGVPLRRQYVCPRDGKVLEPEETVRGYELENGEMVLVEDEEMAGLAPEKGRDISLQKFVKLEDIPNFYFDRPYYLTPAGGAVKAYQLLAYVMEKHGRAGIGTFVMRGKEYLVAIVAEHGLLMAETLRFADEIRDSSQVPLPAPARVKNEVKQEINAVVESLFQKELDEEQLTDRYAARFQRLIEKKRKSEQAIVRHQPEASETPSDDTDETAAPEVFIDLVSIFKARMQEAQSGDDAATEGAEELDKHELYRRAQAANIPGRSKMSKKELAEALSVA